MNILNWFKKKPEFDIKAFERKWPVGSWYKSGGNQIVRLSNVYVKDGVPMITVEYPVAGIANKDYFRIEKDDDLSPSYLNGRIRVEDKEAERLEKSYWKTIEKDLKNKTESAKKTYKNFLDIGGK